MSRHGRLGAAFRLVGAALNAAQPRTAFATLRPHERVQEIGPRFTLKLQSLQKGTFDRKGGEFEWVLKPGEQDTSRRKFQL